MYSVKRRTFLVYIVSQSSYNIDISVCVHTPDPHLTKWCPQWMDDACFRQFSAKAHQSQPDESSKSAILFVQFFNCANCTERTPTPKKFVPATKASRTSKSKPGVYAPRFAFSMANLWRQNCGVEFLNSAARRPSNFERKKTGTCCDCHSQTAELGTWAACFQFLYSENAFFGIFLFGCIR